MCVFVCVRLCMCEQAKIKGLRSRAAFKLQQINDKHKILRPGTRLDTFSAALVSPFLLCVLLMGILQSFALPPPPFYIPSVFVLLSILRLHL